MAETIRSLIVKLGYDVDTTGANVFKSSLRDLNESLKRGVNDSIGGLSSNFGKSFNAEASKMKSIIKKAMLGVVAVAVGAFAAVKKAFTGFATKEQARFSLSAMLDVGEFKKVEDFWNNLPKKIKDVTEEVDVLNSIAGSLKLGQTSDIDFLLKILPFAIQKAKVLGDSVEETMASIVGVISGNLEGAIKLRFTTAEIEKAKERQGIKGRDYGPEAGKALILDLISQREGRTQNEFNQWVLSASAAGEKLSKSLSKTSDDIGEHFSKPLIKAAGSASTALDEFRENLKKTGSIFEAIKLFVFGPEKKGPQGEKITQEVKKLEKYNDDFLAIMNNRNRVDMRPPVSKEERTIIQKTESTFNVNVKGETRIDRETAGKIANEITRSNLAQKTPQSKSELIEVKQ